MIRSFSTPHFKLYITKSHLDDTSLFDRFAQGNPTVYITEGFENYMTYLCQILYTKTSMSLFPPTFRQIPEIGTHKYDLPLIGIAPVNSVLAHLFTFLQTMMPNFQIAIKSSNLLALAIQMGAFARLRSHYFNVSLYVDDNILFPLSNIMILFHNHPNLIRASISGGWVRPIKIKIELYLEHRFFKIVLHSMHYCWNRTNIGFYDKNNLLFWFSHKTAYKMCAELYDNKKTQNPFQSSLSLNPFMASRRVRCLDDESKKTSHEKHESSFKPYYHKSI